MSKTDGMTVKQGPSVPVSGTVKGSNSSGPWWTIGLDVLGTAVGLGEKTAEAFLYDTYKQQDFAGGASTTTSSGASADSEAPGFSFAGFSLAGLSMTQMAMLAGVGLIAWKMLK